MSGTKKKSEENPDKIATDDSDETLIPLHTDDTVVSAKADGQEKVEDEFEEQAETGEEQQPDDELNNIETLMQKLDEQKRVAVENHDRMLRAQAELDNMRKRTARDIENAHKYALERFIIDLLPVLDSMELGISVSADAEGNDSLIEGMNLTFKMFASTLEKFGVKVIDPQGEKFNPKLHEAVSMQDAEEDTASGIIIRVMQKGYELNGRLVRPAMVVVAK
jgi:molecular chaperone GrpE